MHAGTMPPHGGGGGHHHHDDHHGHDHHHDDHHEHEDQSKVQKMVRAKLIMATVFALLFMSVEIAGGIIAGSLAIVTDAAHLFTDVANFISAILASHLAEQGPSAKHSYGTSNDRMGL